MTAVQLDAEPEPFRDSARRSPRPIRLGAHRNAAGTRHRNQRRALVIDQRHGDNGDVIAVSVRCPYCRGVHDHAWFWWAPDYAIPHCGAMAGYRLVFDKPESTITADTQEPTQ